MRESLFPSRVVSTLIVAIDVLFFWICVRYASMFALVMCAAAAVVYSLSRIAFLQRLFVSDRICFLSCILVPVGHASGYGALALLTAQDQHGLGFALWIIYAVSFFVAALLPGLAVAMVVPGIMNLRRAPISVITFRLLVLTTMMFIFWLRQKGVIFPDALDRCLWTR